MVNSKDVFNAMEANFTEFKNNGQAWCDNDDVVAAGRARSYCKKIIKDMRAFVELSIKEAASIKPEPKPEVVEEVQPETDAVE